MMVVVTVGYATIAALSKLLMQRCPVVMIAWARYATPFAMGASGLFRTGESPPWPVPDLGWQLLRSTLMIAGTLLIMLAYKVLPLAQTLTISAIHPLLLTALAALFLGERVTAGMWASAALGFVGVLVIVRPGSNMFTPAALLPLGMACTYAGYMALTRRLARCQTPARSLFYGTSVGTLLTSCLLVLDWVKPDVQMLSALALIGALSAGTHWLTIKALRAAPASLLAPISYAQLLWSVAFGALLFGEIPDVITLTGMGVVVAGGLLLNATQRHAAPCASFANAAPHRVSSPRNDT